jgi:UDP-N-acetyl-D-glucosamine dehydrogenase
MQTLHGSRAFPSARAIYTRPMKIGLIGLGYVGLPLAVAFAEAGDEVVGLDVDPAKVEALGQGRSYIEDIPDSVLAPLGDRLQATTEYADLAACEALVICVPTPLTNSREPDLAYLIEAGTALSEVLRQGQLVVLESTTYPGTTRERLMPLLERSGLSAGSDFHLAFSPERIDPGRTDFTIRTTPKLVGGLTSACAEHARALYERICDRVIVLSSPETAELSKLLENIFRSVNIALVNELAQLCDRLEIDVWEVIEGASTKPFGFMRFDPGPGMGGHCLPVDPFYLAFKARQHDFYPEFIELAGKVNQAQPGFCVERIERVLNEARKPIYGSRILILGASYKGGVGDTRESPALKIIGRLQDLGGEVSYHDPFVPELPGHGLSSVDLREGIAGADLVAIVTAHPNVDYESVVAAAPLVVDFRGVTRGIEAGNLVRL